MIVKKEEESITYHTVLNSLILTIGTGLSKVMGFLREMVIATYFGASSLVDAYLVALVIPQMLFYTVSGSLTTTVLPLCTEYEKKEGRESVLKMLNSVTSFMVLLLAGIITLAELFIHFLVHLIAPGFSNEALLLTENLGRILLPMMLFMGFAGLGTGILQSQKRFFYPAFIGIPYNLIIIIVLFIFGHTWGIWGLTVATLLGVIAQWLFQIPALHNEGFPFRWNLNFSHPGLRKMGLLMVPVIIGSGAGQINLLVDRMVASGFASGSISALNYATKLNLMIYGVLAVAVANAVYPEMASAVVAKDYKKYLSSLVKSLNSLLLIIMPVTVGLLVLRVPIVRLVYERGAFDTAATVLTATSLFFFAFGLPAMCLREVVLRAFYSLQDTLTPMYIGVGTVALNICFIFLLTPYFDLGGLALSTSLSITIGFMVLLWFLRRKIGPIGGGILFVTGIKITTASAIMGIVVWYLYRVLKPLLPPSNVGNGITLILLIMAGFLIYAGLVKMLRVEEVEWVIEKVKVKIKR